MKKIAQVVTQSEMGGAQKHVLILSKQLKKIGYDVDIIAAPGGELKTLAKENGIRFISLDTMVRDINPKQDFKTILNLNKILKREGYDVVHCHSSKAGILGRISAKICGVNKIIYTAHGFVFNEPMSKIKKWIYIIIESIGAKIGTNLIAVSKKDYNCAVDYKLTKKSKITYIPNSIEEIEENSLMNKEEMRRSLGISQDEFVIGTVSNFYETKGHKYLIPALKKLYEEGYKFKTLFAGEGQTMEDMKAMAEGYKDIEFLGYRSDNYNLMNIFDLFVLPSIKEGMPYVVLEALSLGKPLLCTKVGALTDIITDSVNGFIVEPENTQALYEKLKWIFENKSKLQPIALKGKEFIEKNFSIEKFTENILQIYNE